MDMKCIKTIWVLSVFCLVGCTGNQEIRTRMNDIKEIGNSRPLGALAMLDSLNEDAGDWDRHTRNLFDLLQIRLNDKAYIEHKSDKDIKRVVKYFDKYGSDDEKQEAYYYAGSVYRDLQDTPRALENFLKSADYGEGADMVLLRNAYSQLHLLYYSVQDYNNALLMARNEINTAKKLDILDAASLLHESTSLSHLRDVDGTIKSLKYVLKFLSNRADYENHAKELSTLLYHLSYWGVESEAEECYEIVRQYIYPYYDNDMVIAIGQYYEMKNECDSAIFYYKKVYTNQHVLTEAYDASRLLLHLYNKKGDSEKANEYAEMFALYSDSLNLGERQQMAANVNNQYKYYKDYEEEQILKEERERYLKMLWTCIACTVLISLLAYSFYERRKAKHYREIVEKTRELDNAKEENTRLQQEIRGQEEELERAKAQQERNRLELLNVKAELAQSDIELRNAQAMLEEKQALSKHLIQMVNRKQFEGSAKQIVERIRDAAEGRYNMRTEDWQGLGSAVEELYPGISERILAHSGGHISEMQLRICHLMCIGLSNPQIQALTNTPRATIWRWAKKYEWILTLNEV